MKSAKISHFDAECASINNHPGTLAKYLKSESTPDHNVLKTLSRYLEGDDDWVLRFVPRTERPPRKVQDPMWQGGQELALSGRLFQIGQLLWKRLELTTRDRSDLHMLAEALDPKGTSKWKLVFKRPRKGNPATSLERDLKLSWDGHEALGLHFKYGNWNRVDEELEKNNPDAKDNTARKRAVRFVRRARNKGSSRFLVGGFERFS